MLASEVLLQAAVLLTDPAQNTWSNAVLLPMLTKANEELEQEFEVNEIPILKKKSSPVITVEAGDTELDEYPVDIIQPIALYERALSSSDVWREVGQKNEVDPNLITFSEITQWVWENNKIYINPPTTDREVYLRYYRGLTALTSASSNVEYSRAKNFLASRTAQLAALNIGNNPTKADELESDVVRSRDRLIRSMMKRTQSSSGVRRRGYHGLSRRRIALS